LFLWRQEEECFVGQATNNGEEKQQRKKLLMGNTGEKIIYTICR
jgi:hypothetical protein